MPSVKTITASFSHFHRELNDWLKELDFYFDELKLCEERLAEVAGKNTAAAIQANVEHFQNQFILQREQFELLQHDVRIQQPSVEARLVKPARGQIKKDDAGDETITRRQNRLRNKIHDAESIFIGTKQQFYRFLAEVL